MQFCLNTQSLRMSSLLPSLFSQVGAPSSSKGSRWIYLHLLAIGSQVANKMCQQLMKLSNISLSSGYQLAIYMIILDSYSVQNLNQMFIVQGWSVTQRQIVSMELKNREMLFLHEQFLIHPYPTCALRFSSFLLEILFRLVSILPKIDFILNSSLLGCFCDICCLASQCLGRLFSILSD